jgi:hypothetical protein
MHLWGFAGRWVTTTVRRAARGIIPDLWEGAKPMGQAIASHPYRKAIDELIRIGRRERGWDSYNASPVDRQALLAAMALVNRLVDLGPVPEPEVGGLADGSVLLRWPAQDKEVEIIFRDIGGTYCIRRDDSEDVEQASLSGLDALKDIIGVHVLGRARVGRF